MDSPRIFSLNIHASYACRHSGACCSAGWPIPVEPSRQRQLGGALLVPDADGVCRFYERASGLCRVHRDYGETMLPDACHHFPRRARIDDRGVFVTLSHFCPTAAALLVRADVPAAVVASPRAFPADRRYEGLDAGHAWPPLVKADLLFDLPTFDRWERFVVDALASEHPPTDAASADPHEPVGLPRIAVVAERLRRWRPDFGSLASWLDREINRTAVTGEIDAAWSVYARFTDLAAYEYLLSLVPDGLRAPCLLPAARQRWLASTEADGLPPAVVNRYLAAKAFGSWAAYEAFGIRTMVAELVLADVVLRVEAVRAAIRAGGVAIAGDEGVAIDAVRASDWLLIHLVDRPALVRWLGAIEAPAANPMRG